VCGRVGVWVCGCVGVWVCGLVGVWVCGLVGVWVCGCVGVWVCGCVALWVVVMWAAQGEIEVQGGSVKDCTTRGEDVVLREGALSKAAPTRFSCSFSSTEKTGSL
jgi:hypothetical protein